MMDCWCYHEVQKTVRPATDTSISISNKLRTMKKQKGSFFVRSSCQSGLCGSESTASDVATRKILSEELLQLTFRHIIVPSWRCHIRDPCLEVASRLR
mmetsp:Transcript_9175/g.23239  ORF Transcript_9175/g.23239 Transcript_9175/m.23239 type:complete len:98 (+) Transcript_9175:1860-2153(+)